MQIIIREAKLDDAEKLYILNKNELGYDYSLENTIFRLTQLLKDSSNKIFVAEINSQIVAYVHGVDYDLFYCDHLKNIMGLAVYSNYRRKGIGKLLIEAIEN